MKCQKCGSDDTCIIDTKLCGPMGIKIGVPEGSTRRRVKCKTCEHRFTTYEMTVEQIENMRPNLLSDIKEGLVSLLDQLN